MILKEVKHYPDTNSVEATWVDGDGNQLRCHSYDDRQMDMLEADLGADAAEHADLIANVRATQRPLPPVVRDIKGEIDGMERAVMVPRAVREFMLGYMESQFTPEQLAGNPGYVKTKAFDDEIKALRAQL